MCTDPAVEAHAPVKEEEAAEPSDVMIDDLIFSDGAFPCLPDFPCLSSPSPSTSAASTQPKVPCRSSAASSSSSTSSSSPWSFLKAAAGSGEGMQTVAAGGEPAVGVVGPESEGIDILGAIDLWESAEPTDCWDTSSFFLGESCGGDGADGQVPVKDEAGVFGAGGEFPSEDLAKVFFEWLKSNKDSISPEDLRSIKLKRSTIECAASRLGGGKQGRVQLLKLILAWVQNHHLQKKRRRSRQPAAGERTADQDFSAGTGGASQYSYLPPLTFPPPQEPVPVNPNIDYYDAAPYNSYMPYAAEPPPTTFPTMIPAYHCQYYHEQPISPLPPPDFHSAEQAAAVAWQHGYSPVSPRLQPVPAPQFHAGFASHFPGAQPAYSPALGVARLPSATKEARKNRMARHRRASSLHHNRTQQPQQQPQQEQSSDPAAGICDGGSTSSPSNIKTCRNRSFWSSSSPTVSSPAGAAEENLQRHASPPAEKRRGPKSEQNLKFLLQKVLKQSDVGSLGRIVLPKKEAEIHLPELDARDGISIEMEDIGTSRVWNMRYRFWPNNKSRMYLLENTGDFVRTNGLQEGDFIVIYSDVKCGKYMIRGVKVRPPMDSRGGSGRSSAKSHHKEKSGSSSSSNCKSTAEMEGVCDCGGNDVKLVSGVVKFDSRHY